MLTSQVSMLKQTRGKAGTPVTQGPTVRSPATNLIVTLYHTCTCAFVIPQGRTVGRQDYQRLSQRQAYQRAI